MNRILIIDDSIFSIKILEDILKDTYEVLHARKGQEGIDMALQMLPSLILLDIEMPEMDGFEVLKYLKNNKETERIPVIFLTGIIDPLYEERGFLCGAVDYITKPYNSNIVKVRVKTHVELAEYRKQVELQLNLDTLTGVCNRRGFEEQLRKAGEKAIREQSFLSCIIIDIDYFKMVNDTYGHLQGDRVLRRIGAILRDGAAQHNGHVSRYGGEEFVILFTDKTPTAIEQFIRQIYDNTKAAGIPNKKSSVSDILTLSAGCAQAVPACWDDVLLLVKQSDDALYDSKSNGRNRFTWYSSSGS